MSAQGTVKSYNPNKGFGFITQNNGEPDVFVHRSSISGMGLNQGDNVCFDITFGDDGRPRAANVTGGTRMDNQNFGGRGGFGNNNGGFGGNNFGNNNAYGGNMGGGFGGNQQQKPCFSFRDTGACRFGDSCRFSHNM